MTTLSVYWKFTTSISPKVFHSKLLTARNMSNPNLPKRHNNQNLKLSKNPKKKRKTLKKMPRKVPNNQSYQKNKNLSLSQLFKWKKKSLLNKTLPNVLLKSVLQTLKTLWAICMTLPFFRLTIPLIKHNQPIGLTTHLWVQMKS